MTDEKRFCAQNFKIWVAFMMGMVIIVIAIVFFDRALGGGRSEESLRPTGGSYTPETLSVGQSVSYLSLKGSKDTPGAWLGIEAVDITAATAGKLGHDVPGGVLVSKVIENSPAEKAGLAQGDILYEFDYRSVESVDDLLRLLGSLGPNTRVKVALFRDGEREVVYVKLGEITGTTSALAVRQVAGQVAGEVVPNDQKWGIAVSELTESLRKTYGIPKKEEGVVVAMVVPESAADKAGLKNGDLIQQVDRTPVLNLVDFFDALQSATSHIMLKVYREGAVSFVHVIAVSPFMPTGGMSDSEEEEDDEGLKGRPAQIPPMGKPESASIEQVQGVLTAVDGSGINRPLYVPGYDNSQLGDPSKTDGSGINRPLYVPGSDNSQLGDPSEKTRSLSSVGVVTVAGESGEGDDPPVCKRIQEIDNML
jgi:hypothetical protein